MVVLFSHKEGSFEDECFQNLTEEGTLGGFLVCSGCGGGHPAFESKKRTKILECLNWESWILTGTENI